MIWDFSVHVIQLRQRGSYHYFKISVSHISQSHKVFTAPSVGISEEQENALRFWIHCLITHCLYGSSGMCEMQANCKALSNVSDGLWENSVTEKIVKIKPTHWVMVKKQKSVASWNPLYSELQKVVSVQTAEDISCSNQIASVFISQSKHRIIICHSRSCTVNISVQFSSYLTILCLLRLLRLM